MLDLELEFAAAAQLGREHGLPFVAYCHDIAVDAASEPPANAVPLQIWPGQPELWSGRLSLRSPLTMAIRQYAEPFLVTDGAIKTWRPGASLPEVMPAAVERFYGVRSVLVVPVRQTGAVVSVVIWGARGPVDTGAWFERSAPDFLAVAHKLVACSADWYGMSPPQLPRPLLTPREVQCLAWVAAAKTNDETAALLSIRSSTVRFHTRNAQIKLGAGTRASAVFLATQLGYLGSFHQAAGKAAARRALSDRNLASGPSHRSAE